jgi:hypothetical protein
MVGHEPFVDRNPANRRRLPPGHTRRVEHRLCV